MDSNHGGFVMKQKTVKAIHADGQISLEKKNMGKSLNITTINPQQINMNWKIHLESALRNGRV